MPIYEYECPVHGKFERILAGEAADRPQLCSKVLPAEKQKPGFPERVYKCGHACPKVEWSVPARRNPEYGIQ